MSWEWIGTVAVGLGGITATYLTGERGRKHAKQIADSKNDHDRDMAREQRQHQGRESAYVELLTFVHTTLQSFTNVDKETGESKAKFETPGMDWVIHTRALLSAHGSAEVRAINDEWLDLALAANRSRIKLRDATRSDDDVLASTSRQEFKKYLNDARRAAELLGEAVRKDLQGPTS